MKPFLRNTLIITTIAIVVGSYYIKDKIDTAIEVFDKISIKPFALPKNIRFSNPNLLGIPQNISGTIDMQVINDDVQNFSVSGFGVATLKTVKIYFKNILIGEANVFLDEIEVPARGNAILKNIPFTGKTLSILSNATAFSNAKISDFNFISTIEVAGIEYEI